METSLVLLEEQQLRLPEELVREFSRGSSVNTLLGCVWGKSWHYYFDLQLFVTRINLLNRFLCSCQNGICSVLCAL